MTNYLLLVRNRLINLLSVIARKDREDIRDSVHLITRFDDVLAD